MALTVVIAPLPNSHRCFLPKSVFSSIDRVISVFTLNLDGVDVFRLDRGMADRIPIDQHIAVDIYVNIAISIPLQFHVQNLVLYPAILLHGLWPCR